MSEAAQREANLRCLHGVIEKMSTGRSQEVLDDISEDFEFELPYGPDRQALQISGPKAFGQLNAMTWAMFEDFGLTVTRIHEMRSPDELIVEYRSEGSVKATGKPYCNRYIGIFGFTDGLISRWTEFHNPEITAEAMRPDPGAAS